MNKTVFFLLSLVAGLSVRAELSSDILLDEEKLIEIIGKPDTSDNDMVTACQNLGWCGGAKAIGSLAGLLGHEKAIYRHAARYGLEMIPDPAVEVVLIDATGRLSGPALVGVLQSLGNRGSEKSVAALARSMADGDAAVAQAAVQALGKLGLASAMQALKPGLGKCPKVAQAYLAGAKTIARKNPSKAAELFAEIRACKQNVCPSVRLAAARGEMLSSGKQGLQLWSEMITSADARTSDTALRVVLDFPSDRKATAVFAGELVVPLAKMPETQAKLALVLGKRGDTAAVPALAALADCGSGASCQNRLAAASALAMLNDPAAIPPLQALAGSDDAAVAEAAKNDLMGFTGKAADDAVLAMMGNAEASIRMAGLEMALRRRMVVAVPAMVKLSSDSDAKIADAAVKGVGDLGTAEEIPLLLSLIRENPQNESAVRALSSLCSRYARPRGGKTGIKSAAYGFFESGLTKDVTANVQRLVDAGSITIQSSGRLCKWDGFSEDPAPGKQKSLRMVYTFDGVEKSVQVRENESVHLSGEKLLPVAMDPIKAAYDAASGEHKIALLRALISLSNQQGLEIARAAAQDKDAALQEAAIRALAAWRTPEALDDAARYAKDAPSERLKILALRGFLRQLEMSFTIPLDRQIAMLEDAQSWAVRDEDKTLVNTMIDAARKLQGELGFKPMFDGKSLDQWKGGGGWWEVKDGILQAQSSVEKPCTKNSQLIWTGGQPADFEIRADFKLSPTANSGIQLRAADEEFGDTGYQADMNGGGDYVGFLYHPKQHLVGERGAKVTIATDGKKTVERFADAKELGDKVFKKDDWNEYTIIAKGSVITLYVNGMKTCELIDHRPEMMPKKGVITLQMHAGPPMKIQYRNLRIKML
ncbi:MAG: DUF1080 domain-containing protein [Kiritimatiellae bacterium]|nr:DUF1080 domain-containing protein [Kiritimatiellia bacterium]